MLVDGPPGARATLVLAHGAGDRLSPAIRLNDVRLEALVRVLQDSESGPFNRTPAPLRESTSVRQASSRAALRGEQEP
jgi:hypothetical protein